MNFLRLNKKWLILFVTSLMMILLVTVVYALTPIDTFNDTTQVSDVSTTACTVASGADMIGGQRDVEVARTAGLDTVVARVNDTQPGKLGFAVGPGTTGSVLVQWDGNDADCTLNATGLMGQNLNPDDGLALYLEQIDLGATITMRVYTDAANYSTFDYVLPTGIAAPGQTLYFPFDDFTDVGGGATFTNVGAIELFVSGASIDMILDFVNSDLTRDFGDLPTAYNNITLLANDGARHILEDVYFGTVIDADGDGQTSATATGDDATNSDEDGLDAVTGSNWGDGGGQISLNATVPAADTVACVVGWIDWDGSGSFDTGGTTGGVSELVYNNFAGTGASTLNITTPTLANYGGAYPATLNARFRIFERNADLFTTLGLTVDGIFGCPTGETEANLIQLLNGQARNGEVEDYQWGFSPTAVTLQDISASDSTLLPFALGAFGLIVFSTGLVINRKRKAVK